MGYYDLSPGGHAKARPYIPHHCDISRGWTLKQLVRIREIRNKKARQVKIFKNLIKNLNIWKFHFFFIYLPPNKQFIHF